MAGVDVRMFSVGPIQENAYIVRAGPDARRAVLVDPGEEPERLLDAASSLGVEIEAILITHCHFDHIGAVVTGPAIVEQFDATTVIPAGWTGRVDGFRNLILEKA